jgi:hypothetical protein
MVNRLKWSRQSLVFSFFCHDRSFAYLSLDAFGDNILLRESAGWRMYSLFGGTHQQVACPDLEGGESGVYLTSNSLDQKLRNRPLDLLAPGPAWKEIAVTVGERVGGSDLSFSRRKINKTEYLFVGP